MHKVAMLVFSKKVCPQTPLLPPTLPPQIWLYKAIWSTWGQKGHNFFILRARKYIYFFYAHIHVQKIIYTYKKEVKIFRPFCSQLKENGFTKPFLWGRSWGHLGAKGATSQLVFGIGRTAQPPKDSLTASPPHDRMRKSGNLAGKPHCTQKGSENFEIVRAPAVDFEKVCFVDQAEGGQPPCVFWRRSRSPASLRLFGSWGAFNRGGLWADKPFWKRFQRDHRECVRGNRSDHQRKAYWFRWIDCVFWHVYAREGWVLLSFFRTRADIKFC